MFTATLDTAQILSFIVSAVLPVLVAVITARSASDGFKAWLLLGLSALTGFLTNWLSSLNSGMPFNIAAALITVAISFATAVISHQGILLPIGLTGADGSAARVLPNGIVGRRKAS
jgi:carbon starvation protein CstA